MLYEINVCSMVSNLELAVQKRRAASVLASLLVPVKLLVLTITICSALLVPCVQPDASANQLPESMAKMKFMPPAV
eukprot:1153961-Pelagomonas_calceolata.AAC.2